MKHDRELVGAGTALVTPFRVDGSVDLEVFRVLVRRQVEAGVRLLVPCGTTGESATLSPEERELLVRATVEEAAGRALVVAGTGSNDTRLAAAMARAAAGWGADAVLSLAPPYVKPPQDALIDHFRAVAEAARVPVVVYNVPSRVGCNLRAETTLALAEVPGIAGVKEAAGDMDQAMEILRSKPRGFAFLSGEDALALPLLALGAEGVISVVGNEAPRDLVELVTLARAGRIAQARAVHERLLPLMRANFCESNPIPVKAAMARMGLLDERLRRPLRPLAASRVAELEAACVAAGLTCHAASSAAPHPALVR